MSRARRARARFRRGAAPHPAPRPAGAGSRASTCWARLDERHLTAQTSHDLCELDTGRPTSEHDQPSGHGSSSRSPRSCPRRRRALASREPGGRPDRRHWRVRRGRPCSARLRPRPFLSRRDDRDRAAGRSLGPPATARLRCRSSSETMKSRQSSAACTSTSALAPASRALCTASPGRSSDFDGMHAQYEHRPPTRSRSTTATRSPPSAIAAAAVLSRRSATEDDHVVVGWSRWELLAGLLADHVLGVPVRPVGIFPADSRFVLPMRRCSALQRRRQVAR